MASKKEKSVKETIQEIVQTLLDKLGVKTEIEISFDGENKVWNIQLETDEAGILIGRRGETLHALQSIVRQICFSRLSESVNIIINVGDWRQKREETLRNLALSTATRVKETGNPQNLYDLSPADRRYIHMVLSSEEGVATLSEGEGRERHLIVKPA